jgi:hypothetical protein
MMLYLPVSLNDDVPYHRLCPAFGLHLSRSHSFSTSPTHVSAQDQGRRDADSCDEHAVS